MRPIRLDTQILLYFLIMVVIVFAFLGLNQRAQQRSLQGFGALLEIYSRADRVHTISADMASLQLQVSQYYDYPDASTLAGLDGLQKEIFLALSYLKETPSSAEEEQLIAELEGQLNQFFSFFHARLVPQIDTIKMLHEKIQPAFDPLIAELDRIGTLGPGKDRPLELGPIFNALQGMRTQTTMFAISPAIEFSNDLHLLHNTVKEQVEEFGAYYDSLYSRGRGVDELYAQINQLVQITRGYLYNTNVHLANDINRMVQTSEAIERLYTAQAGSSLEQYRQLLSQQELQYLILAGLAAILAIFLSWLISRQIGTPIHALIEVFQQLASGRRVTKIPMIHRKDDFGKLARAAEIFRHKNEDTQYLLHQSQSLVRELQDLNSELNEQISVRQRVESNLARRQDELERSNRDLSQFAYAASHDLQEPLRMVSSYLQLLERRYKDQLDSDAHDFISYAVDGASRMKNLIRSLLDYSRIGTHGAEFGEVYLNTVIENVLKNLELLINENQASVTYDDLPLVWGDEAQLQTLIQNIVSNSIRYRGESPPKIHIATVTKAGFYELSIADNGIGFEQQFSEKIFTIFQRLHTRDSYPEGTGIGLALSKRIVERHGGSIWADSEPGKGTTIHFTIPVKGVPVSDLE